MRMLREGPEVSLNGSPTVSPITAALWASEPLPPKLPCSMYFLALSHAPPLFAINTARTNPDASAPPRSPKTPDTPSKMPVSTGAITASSDGKSISFCAAFVEMDTHLA